MAEDGKRSGGAIKFRNLPAKMVPNHKGEDVLQIIGRGL